ncbi:MAG: hypothetical protein JW934_12685 [Anaerolineae bacterium]|nr:hypothetical protein [Anaerolineae bacterium]
MSKQTLTFVSHTHWDREWYQPFEEFRIRLVQLVDKLLHILDSDPEYRYFMLDGQTIVLDDYLAIRPENRARIEKYVQNGRIQIGPWYILPDEFLVSGESTVRNLLVGARMCAAFGKRMDVGNIPDPFGHISQMPQILRGFDIDTMVFWRGVSGVQNEFIWQASDGSEVLVVHQHEGYGNAANMPTDTQAFIGRTQQIINSLTPTATTPHLLAMNGSDHVEPMAELPRLLAAARTALPDMDIQHGTLPQFIEKIRAQNPTLETRRGEMRDSARSPLLPGVLSARMWIKQRNAASETLLTRWAEPMTTLAELNGAPLALHGQDALVRQAWRYLLQNHPHDSICGCSVDQVHREMKVRFDWVDQIGEQVTSASLGGLTAIVDTSNADNRPAVVVFNPTTRPRSDMVAAQVPLPENAAHFVLAADDGQLIRPQIGERGRDVLWEFTAPAAMFITMVGEVPYEIEGAGIQAINLAADGTLLELEIVLAKGQPPNVDAIKRGQAEIMRMMETTQIEQVHLVIHHGEYAQCTFVAPDVPGLGYRVYWVQPVVEPSVRLDEPPARIGKPASPGIENEFFRVQVNDDGTLTLTDKTTGAVYPGLNHFVDVGDRGDEYNFCPVENDVVVSTPAGEPLICLTEYGPARQTLEVSMTYQVPASLGETRAERSDEWIDLPITTRISLSPGVRRVDISTTVENDAADHRLRVHFPLPVRVDTFDAEGHFDIITRSIDLPTGTEDWVEQPVSTHPQCAWAGVSDGKIGMLVANRGLPEIEAVRIAPGTRGDSGRAAGGATELALTLLRAVGWLSRGDMSVRQGHAGPGLPTPEAQCIGEHTFDYALIPHGGASIEAIHAAQAFNAPLRAVATLAHAGELPSKGSWVEVEPENLLVTAIKESEEGRGLIVRFWNTGEAAYEATVKFWQKPVSVAHCNLGERVLDTLDIDEAGRISVRVRGREIVTLLAKF